MRLLILILFIFQFHSGDLARFSFSSKEDFLFVEGDIGYSDLKKVLVLNSGEEFEALKSYFKSNLQIKINNRRIKYTLLSFDIKNEDHVEFILKSENKINTFQNIQITNTCLFDVNPNQMNIININFNSTSRDFLIDMLTPTLNIKL